MLESVVMPSFASSSSAHQERFVIEKYAARYVRIARLVTSPTTSIERFVSSRKRSGVMS